MNLLSPGTSLGRYEIRSKIGVSADTVLIKDFVDGLLDIQNSPITVMGEKAKEVFASHQIQNSVVTMGASLEIRGNPTSCGA